MKNPCSDINIVQIQESEPVSQAIHVEVKCKESGEWMSTFLEKVSNSPNFESIDLLFVSAVSPQAVESFQSSIKSGELQEFSNTNNLPIVEESAYLRSLSEEEVGDCIQNSVERSQEVNAILAPHKELFHKAVGLSDHPYTNKPDKYSKNDAIFEHRIIIQKAREAGVLGDEIHHTCLTKAVEVFEETEGFTCILPEEPLVRNPSAHSADLDTIKRNDLWTNYAKRLSKRGSEAGATIAHPKAEYLD